ARCDRTKGAVRRRCRDSGTVRAERGSISARPKLRAEIAVPLARVGIAAHVALPSRKSSAAQFLLARALRTAHPGAPEPPPCRTSLRFRADTLVRREETTHRQLCPARRTAFFLELKRARR